MSAWKDFVTASLLGTGQGGAMPALPASLENTLSPAASLAPEARFLTRAGALALWRRTGWKPDRSEAPSPSPAPPETWPLVNPASIDHLRTMLGGHCAEVLPEWLGAAAQRQRRVPPELLPALLDWASQKHTRRDEILTAGGTRLRWLAGQNPAWSFAADHPLADWATGTREERMTILRRWRTEQPADARAALDQTWKEESADARAKFLWLVGQTLTREDEPLLERALDDRSKEVRAAAVEILHRMPESALAGRMAGRGSARLTFKPGGLLRRAALEISLPDEPDDAGRRDGLDPQTFGMYRKEFGDRAKVLIQILGAAPLGHWTKMFDQTPASLLQAAAKHEFASAVATGWALAAVRQQNGAWAEALFDSPVKVPTAFLPFGGLFSALPAASRTARLIAALRRGATDARFTGEGWPHLFTRFAEEQASLPETLAREALSALRHAAQTETQGLSHLLRPMAGTLALKMPPAMLPDAAAGWPLDKPGVAELTALLTFRHDALISLA